jgi:V/A-type H+-transporting ATPase subunit A
MKSTGIVTGIVSNLVTIDFTGHVAENEICYIDLNGVKLMAEVIKVNGNHAFVQVYESTRGLKIGNTVEFEDTCSK